MGNSSLRRGCGLGLGEVPGPGRRSSKDSARKIITRCHFVPFLSISCSFICPHPDLPPTIITSPGGETSVEGILLPFYGYGHSGAGGSQDIAKTPTTRVYLVSLLPPLPPVVSRFCSQPELSFLITSCHSPVLIPAMTPISSHIKSKASPWPARPYLIQPHPIL